MPLAFVVESVSSRFTARPLWILIGLVLVVAGCQKDTPPPNTGGPNNAAAQGTSSGTAQPTATLSANAEADSPAGKNATAPSAGGSAKPNKSAAPAAEPLDNVVRRPATVEEAIAALDLRELPLAPGSNEAIERNIVHLMYQAPGDPKSAFEFHQKELHDRGWKELTEANILETSASALLTRDGFRISLSASAGIEPGNASVMIWNHGNVNLRKLPVPQGAKLRYPIPGTAAYVVEAGLDETTAAVRELLLAEGWQPYGSAGDVGYFKQNAIKLYARVTDATTEPGKTAIDYSTELLAADLPAPPDATRVDFNDSKKRLYVEAPGKPRDVVAFYRTALEPAGWEATTDKPITERRSQFLVFRNPAQDMLTLTIFNVPPGTRIELTHQSAAEVEAEDRRIEEAQAELRRKEQEIANRPKPSASVTVPKGAQAVDDSGGRLEIQIAAGQGQVAARAIAAELEADGWESQESSAQKSNGEYNLKKGRLSIRVFYIDPGPIPAEITVSGYGLEIMPAPAKDE